MSQWKGHVSLRGTPPPLAKSFTEQEAWAIANRVDMKGAPSDWKDWTERTKIIRWALSNQVLFLTGTQRNWARQCRVQMNMLCRKDHSEPCKLFGKTSSAWCKHVIALRKQEEGLIGEVPWNSPYFRAMDDWILVVKGKENMDARRYTQRSNGDRALAAREELKRHVFGGYNERPNKRPRIDGADQTDYEGIDDIPAR